MNIGTMIIFGIMCICGGLSTIYVVISLPATIIYKIFRKIKYGEKMM